MTNFELLEHYSYLIESASKVKDEIIRRDIDWRHIAESNHKVLAVFVYYRKHKTSVSQAKEIVEAYLKEKEEYVSKNVLSLRIT